MNENWKQWEGRTVDGRFPLQSYLGGSDHSAVFLTQGADSKNAAIKLISADLADAEKRLLRWKAGRDLNHPHLIRIFEAGRCELSGTSLLYVVEEYAEENLSQILPERALTAEESRGMLPPVLRALQFLHDKGFVHGHIQPSNILAVADQVKLSSDALGVPGEQNGAGARSAYDPPEAGTLSTAGDVWQLGITLIEVLTQRLPAWDRSRSIAPEVPATVPEQFREIAAQCLQVDAGKRWSVAEVSNCLGGKPPAPKPAQPAVSVARPVITGQEKASAKWPYWVGLAAVVAVIFFVMGRPKTTSPTVEVQGRPATGVETSQPAPASAQQPKSAVSKNSDLRMSANPEEGRVAERVMPQVSPGALHSIRGKIRIQVRVDVDENGNVTQARLKTAGPSKYFARQALEAARKWTFTPPRQNGHPVASRWVVQFALTRRAIDDSVVRIEP